MQGTYGMSPIWLLTLDEGPWKLKYNNKLLLKYVLSPTLHLAYDMLQSEILSNV